MTSFFCSLIVLIVTLIYFLMNYDRQSLDALVIWNLVYSQVLFHAPPVRPVVITILGCLCSAAFILDWKGQSFSPVWLIVLPLLVIATWEDGLSWIRRFLGFAYSLIGILFFWRKKGSFESVLCMVFIGFALGYERMTICVMISGIFALLCWVFRPSHRIPYLSCLIVGYGIGLKMGHELYTEILSMIVH